MQKFLYSLILCFILFSTSAKSQGIIHDDFSKKDMPGWIWGGVEMKYSHETDNKENGFSDIFTKTIVKPSSYIGKITRYSPVLLTAGNFINAMFKGVKNDVTVKIQILYDIDGNAKYNDDKDIMLESIPVTLNFDGWKEVKIKLDEENFKLISKFKDDFSVTEQESVAIQFEFESGKNYKESKFESGIALISEIVSKDNLNSENKSETLDGKTAESYFEAKNYPNPFNPSTTISYNLKEATNVSLAVYDRLGREVKLLVDQMQNAGLHTVEFNGSQLPSGIYFYRIKTSERTEVRKMILAK